MLFNNSVIVQVPATEKRKRSTTRERVLDAAERLFVEGGFHATSVKDIAEAAGYTTGAIYSSFDGKGGLFLAVYRRRSDAQVAFWRDASVSSPDDVAVAAAATLKAVTYEPGWYAATFEFFSYAIRHPDLGSEVGQIMRDVEPVFANLLGPAADSAPLPFERLAPIVVALLRGLAWSSFLDPDGADDTLFADAVSVLVGVAPKHSRRRTKPRLSPGQRRNKS